MTATVLYENNLRTSCTHLQSGSKIETDAPTDNAGKGERFSPTDLLATALAACMLTVMGIKAKGLHINLEGLRVDAEKLMKAEPRRVGGINLTVFIPEHLVSIEKKNIAILKNTADTCPVMKSLHPDIVVNVNWGAWT